MRFQETIEFQGSLAQVRDLLADTSFREEVARKAGASQASATMSAHEDGHTITIDSRQPTSQWPSIVAKFLGDNVAIRQEERWNSAAGELSVTIPGQPVNVVGTLGLVERDGHTVQTVDADVSVKVPFVGGKIEGLVVDVLGHVLTLQARVGNERLQG